MKKYSFSSAVCLSLLIGSSAFAKDAKPKKEQRQVATASAAQCDSAARSILANNAQYKIEDTSKTSDFKLNSTLNLGDAAGARVVSIYTDPNDGSAYLIEFYGEGCAMKAFVHL
jgi:hypothetical protein